MKHHLRTLSSILLTSYMCFGSDAQASMGTEIEHITLKVPASSAIASQFNKTPNAAIRLLNTFCEKTNPYLTSEFLPQKDSVSEGDEMTKIEFNQPIDSQLSQALGMNNTRLLQAYEASLNNNSPLEVLAASGSFGAMRRLADKSTNEEEKLKWVFVELLASFGESVNLNGLKAAKNTTQMNQQKVTMVALKNAAFWVRENIYRNPSIRVVYQVSGPDVFKGKLDNGYNCYLKAGDVVGFFQNMAFSAVNTRSLYLEFFLHLGISDVNLDMAFKRLDEAEQNEFAAAKELSALMNYAKQLTSNPLRKLKVTVKKSTRPQWSGIQDNPAPVKNMEEAVELLGKTLNLPAK